MKHFNRENLLDKLCSEIFLWRGILFFIFLILATNCQPRSENKDKRAAIGLLGLLFSTSTQVTQTSTPTSPGTYLTNASKIEIQVLYEPGAEPLTDLFSGQNANPIFPWAILENNLNEFFLQRNQGITLNIPKSIDSMNLIPDQSKDSWSLDEIKNLINKYANIEQKAGTAKIFIVYLNGNYFENGKKNKNVTGINLVGSPYIGIFSKVIHTNGKANPNLTHIFKEQSIIVHEVGHVLGLVNNGIPLVTEHQDTANGYHCTNKNCVMYWANSGNGIVGSFISGYITTGKSILFQSECLLDVQKYSKQILSTDNLREFIDDHNHNLTGVIF